MSMRKIITLGNSVVISFGWGDKEKDDKYRLKLLGLEVYEKNFVTSTRQPTLWISFLGFYLGITVIWRK